MKLSISLPEADVAALDRYARDARLPSRSAAIQHAVRMLNSRQLVADYTAAWDEWEASGDVALWDQTVGDGLSDAAR